MDKGLRKCYECLDLPFSATAEDVEIRKNALIKVYNNKAVGKGISFERQIEQIETSASTIVENLKNNGTPIVKNHYFDSSWKSIAILGIVLAFVAMFCFFSFYIFLQ